MGRLIKITTYQGQCQPQVTQEGQYQLMMQGINSLSQANLVPKDRVHLIQRDSKVFTLAVVTPFYNHRQTPFLEQYVVVVVIWSTSQTFLFCFSVNLNSITFCIILQSIASTYVHVAQSMQWSLIILIKNIFMILHLKYLQWSFSSVLNHGCCVGTSNF